MTLSDVMFWFLVTLGSLMVLVAHWLGAWALFPACVEGCRERYGRRPVAATLLGLAVLVPALILGANIGKATNRPLVQALLVAVSAVPFLLAMLGSAGLASRIGAGLPSELDQRQPWRRMLRGGVVLGLSFLTPFLGWFVLFPWVLVSGFGAALMTLCSRAPARVPAALPGSPGAFAPPQP
jgi:hypothetical protein